MSTSRLPGGGSGRRRAGARPTGDEHDQPATAGTAALETARDGPASPEETRPTVLTRLTSEHGDATATAPHAVAAGSTTTGELASRTARAMAAVIDIAVPVCIYLLAAALGTALRDAGNRLAVTVLLLGYICVVVWIWWEVVAQGRTGQSFGKRLTKVRVVDEGGAPQGPARSALRLVLHVLDLLPLGLGFVWPLWDRERQTFADKLARTTVVRA